MRRLWILLLATLSSVAACTLPSPQGLQPEPQGPVIAAERQDAAGNRAYRAPAMRWWGRIGVGTIDFEAPGTTLDDRTNARELRFGFAGHAPRGYGPALELRAFTSENELFEGAFLSDGASPRPANAQAQGLSASPHMLLETTAGDMAIALRAGFFLDYLEHEYDSAAIDRSWWTLGTFLAAEPRLPIASANNGTIELFGRCGAGLGHTWFRETYVDGNDRDQTLAWNYHAALGLGWREDNWVVDVGYEFGQMTYDGTDTSLFGTRNDVVVERQQVFFGGTITF